jgi:hypothetical protein
MEVVPAPCSNGGGDWYLLERLRDATAAYAAAAARLRTLSINEARSR